MIALGIDPARGWAIAEDGKIVKCGTVAGVKELTAKIIAINAAIKLDLVRIEKPKNMYVYQRPGYSVARMKHVAQSVGQNFAKADGLVFLCEGLGINVEVVPPLRGFVKLNAITFKTITGYHGKTSEHARDAGMLVHGRKTV